MAQCFEGLPDLPGAPQGYGRPTSNTLLSRFAPARRPDQCEGQLGSYPSRLTLCGVCMPEGRGTEMHAFWAYDLERDARLLSVWSQGVCVCPKAGTQRCMPSRHMISGGVCVPEGRDTEMHAFWAYDLRWCVPAGSDTDGQLEEIPNRHTLLIPQMRSRS